MKIPIVGYTGHRKGETAENLFGQNYRASTIQSKKLERKGLLNKSHYRKS